MKNITTEPLWNPKRPLIFQKALFFLFNVPGFQLLVFSRGYSILSFPWSLRFGHTRGELLAVEEESEAVEGNLQNRPSVDASEIPRKKNTFYLGCFQETCRSFRWDNQHINWWTPDYWTINCTNAGIDDRLSRFLVVVSACVSYSSPWEHLG